MTYMLKVLFALAENLCMIATPTWRFSQSRTPPVLGDPVTSCDLCEHQTHT